MGYYLDPSEQRIALRNSGGNGSDSKEPNSVLATPEGPAFMPSARYRGHQVGYEYKQDEKGLGYYRKKEEEVVARKKFEPKVKKEIGTLATR